MYEVYKKYIYKKILFSCLIILSHLTYANAVSTKSDSLLHSEYIESYSQKFGLYLYGITKFSNFDLNETGQKGDSLLRYSPNGNFNMGLGLSYKWFGFAAVFNFGAINNDEALKGKTTSLDIQLDIYMERMILNGNFQYYKGYFWKNPEKFFPDWNLKDSLVIRPDISTAIFGLNGIYIFNHDKFSIKSTYQYTERQMKSAGSILLGSRFSIYNISADSSIVPTELHNFYPNSLDIGSLSSASFGASFGYTYTFIFGKYFYINGLLMTGLNLQLLTANDFNEEQISSDIKLSTNITFRAAMGFNRPKVYYGINFIVDSFSLRNQNKADLSYSYGKFKIYYGLRFNLDSR